MKFVLQALILLPTPFIRGWVLACLYSWFVVQTFNVPPITPAAAYGIASIAFLTVHSPNFRELADMDEMSVWAARIITAGYVLPAMALSIGWLVQRFWL